MTSVNLDFGDGEAGQRMKLALEAGPQEVEGAPTVSQYLMAARAVRLGGREPPSQFKFAGPEDFLLREGKVFPWKPLPSRLSHGALKACYKNSLDLVVKSRGRYIYCEGMAWFRGGVIATHHGWCLDRDGHVVDVTWRVSPEEGTSAEYLGIPFDTQYARIAFGRSGCVLEDYGGHFPILTGKAGPETYLHETYR